MSSSKYNNLKLYENMKQSLYRCTSTLYKDDFYKDKEYSESAKERASSSFLDRPKTKLLSKQSWSNLKQMKCGKQEWF